MSKQILKTEALEDATPPDQPLYPDWLAVSPKEEHLNAVLLRGTDGKLKVLLERLVADEEIHQMLSYANAVSIRRLGFNDHGPVHARITTYSALKILRLLRKGGIRSSLEMEEVGTYEDAQVGMALGCFLHDIGMGVARQAHEWYALTLADGIIRRMLADLYPAGDPRRVVLRALAHEVISGHMGKNRVHSIEAGVVMVADGSDMSKGRSRIPQLISQRASVGDMHRYSASAISRVFIEAGENKPVRIRVVMDNVTGLFQVEEVMMGKLKASPIMNYVELLAIVGDDPPRFYLR